MKLNKIERFQPGRDLAISQERANQFKKNNNNRNNIKKQNAKVKHKDKKIHIIIYIIAAKPNENENYYLIWARF